MNLTNIVALVTFTFLQLWLTQDSWKKLAEIALNLAVVPQQFQTNSLYQTSKFKERTINLCAMLMPNFFPMLNISMISQFDHIEQLRLGGKDKAETFKVLSQYGWKAFAHHTLAQVFLFLECIY